MSLADRKMSLADLKAECKQLGLPVGGNKPDLLNRILKHREVCLGLTMGLTGTDMLLWTFFGRVSDIC